MSALDFQDREPELNRPGRSNNQLFAGNSAFYERLQGQGRKGAMERYGWIALPVAAVAIVGVVAATSTPHKSADDVVGAPGQMASAASTPAPVTAKPATPTALNEALASNDSAQTPAEAALSGKSASTASESVPAAKSPASAPAPVKVARKAARAPAATDTSIRPAAAAPVERVAPAPETPAPAAAAPAIQTPAPAVTQDAAPQPVGPATPAPSTDSSSSATPTQSAPIEATPAQ